MGLNFHKLSSSLNFHITSDQYKTASDTARYLASHFKTLDDYGLVSHSAII